MIDLSCYLLDGMDYGPNSFAESLEMCRQAVADGVHTVVATPRWQVEADEPPLSFVRCQQKLEHLHSEMRGALSLKLGFVMRWSPSLLTLVKQYNSRLTLGGGHYILISLPSLSTPANTEEVLNELLGRKLNAIISRPECSPAIRHDRPRLAGWIAGGMVLQIDAASVTGVYGREVRRFAIECIQEFPNSVVVASNKHDVVSLRRPSLLTVRQELVKKIGLRRTRLIMTETPAAILEANEQQAATARASRSSLAAFLRPLKLRNTLTDAS